MNKTVSVLSLCHERITAEACLARLLVAQEEGWTVIYPPAVQQETSSGIQQSIPLISNGVVVEGMTTQPHDSLNNHADSQPGSVGLGSAFLLVLLIMLGFGLAAFFRNKYRHTGESYEPRFVASPWQFEGARTAELAIRNMRPTYPDSAVVPIPPSSESWGQVPLGVDGPVSNPGNPGDGNPLSSHPPIPTNSPTDSPQHGAEYSHQLPTPVLKLLPFDPRKGVQLFEFECFKEAKRLIPDITVENLIYLIWKVRKSGTDKKYLAARQRHDDFIDRLGAVVN